MWVCFYHIWFQSAQNQASSVIQVQTDLFQAEATEVKKEKKNGCASFQLLQRWSGARTFSEMLLLELPLHHADNMEIIISG